MIYRIVFLLMFVQSTLVFSQELLWMLRFDDVRAHRHMNTGCYGTASYGWVGPSINTLKKYRKSLLEYTKENADDFENNKLAWSMTKGSKAAHRIALNLETGVEEEIAEVFAQKKAYVFCVCRYDALPDCDKTRGRLGPLDGRPSFIAGPDEE